MSLNIFSRLPLNLDFYTVNSTPEEHINPDHKHLTILYKTEILFHSLIFCPSSKANSPCPVPALLSFKMRSYAFVLLLVTLVATGSADIDIEVHDGNANDYADEVTPQRLTKYRVFHLK